jgi:eukaryotic-like serine/threonine-protein kinase
VIGTQLCNRYRLEERIGSGGMSTVYRAFDETLERQVAVKVMHQSMYDDEVQLERFRREARTVARLSHPHVVTVIDAGEDGGHPFIVFEFVDGETLKGLIRRVGPLPVTEAVAYAIEIGRALIAAHGQRLAHRDVKPQNVLIDPDGRAKVTDFGISRSLDQDGGLTATGRVLGTTDYVAPEQAMGHPVDQRSDVYSLGVVLYEMLVGQVPFHADSQVGVAMKHVNEELPDVQQRRPELSAAAAMVVERATAKDPDRRYQQVGELIDDLSTALEVEAARAGGATGEATSVLDAVPPAERKLGGGGGRRSWLAIGLLVLIAAAVLLAVQLIGSGSGPGGGGALKGKGSPVAVAEASDYDPQGDDSEDPETVSLAVDGDPTTTAWSSEHYDTEDFAGTKSGPNPGVGLYVVSKATTTPAEMVIHSPSPGWDAQIYAAPSGPPEELAEWGEPVGEVTDAQKNEEVELHLGSPAKYFLIWFTRAASSQEQEGRYQVEISDVKLLD